MLSPCIHVCQIKGSSCIGCERNLHEIAHWKDLNQDEQKRIIKDVLPLRKTIRNFDLTSLSIRGRRLQKEDEQTVFQHFLNLEPEARRSRFGYHPHEDTLKKWVHDLNWEHNLIWGIPDETETDSWMAVGVLSPEKAFISKKQLYHRFEVGLSVLKKARGQGLGSALMQGALDVAKHWSVHGQIILYTQKDCVPIFRLVTKHGGVLKYNSEDAFGFFEW